MVTILKRGYRDDVHTLCDRRDEGLIGYNVTKPNSIGLFVVVGTRTINLFLAPHKYDDHQTQTRVELTMPKVKSILQRFLPFYDESSVPPSSLTAQLELFGNTHHSLAVGVLPVVQIQIALPGQPALPKTLPSKEGRAARSPYPTTKQERQRSKARVRSHDRADLESPSKDSSSSLDPPSDSESTSTTGTLSGQPKIPKPPGEPGRPGRGGYNLECAIEWDSKVYTKLKARPFRCDCNNAGMITLIIRQRFTHQLIDEHLDTTKCASAQNLAFLKVVRDKVIISLEPYDASLTQCTRQSEHSPTSTTILIVGRLLISS